MADNFSIFLDTVSGNDREFVSALNEYILSCGGTFKLKEAKSGYVVSYVRPDGKTLLNYDMRKSGIKVRLYAAHIGQYQELLGSAPDKVKKDIIKASDCKKLNGLDCSPSCSGGYMFEMDGVLYKKCKSMAFMPALCCENYGFIRSIVENEMKY